MAEQEAEFHSGSGQYEMALEQESGEGERREHTPAPLNCCGKDRAAFSVQSVKVLKEEVHWLGWQGASVSSWCLEKTFNRRFFSAWCYRDCWG